MINKHPVFRPHRTFVGPHAAVLAPSKAYQAKFAFYQQGLHDQAEPLYQAVLRQDRNHFPSLYNLGLILLQRGKVDEALSLFPQGVLPKAEQP